MIYLSGIGHGARGMVLTERIKFILISLPHAPCAMLHAHEFLFNEYYLNLSMARLNPGIEFLITSSSTQNAMRK